MINVLRSLLFIMLLAASTVRAQDATPIDVFKSPYCGCCEKWIKHLEKSGFTVNSKNVDDVSAIRKETGMPDHLASCHTARIGEYVIEGHVPAADIRRLLKEKPKALGLTVPAMPHGSPGMESDHAMPYDTLLVETNGQSSIFAKH